MSEATTYLEEHTYYARVHIYPTLGRQEFRPLASSEMMYKVTLPGVQDDQGARDEIKRIWLAGGGRARGAQVDDPSTCTFEIEIVSVDEQPDDYPHDDP